MKNLARFDLHLEHRSLPPALFHSQVVLALMDIQGLFKSALQRFIIVQAMSTFPPETECEEATLTSVLDTVKEMVAP